MNNLTTSNNVKNYAFARKSGFSNLGEDVKGSVRHQRNRHLDLERAEWEQTAKEDVKRDALLKSDPPNFPQIDESNYLQILTAYLCLKSIPTGPSYKFRDDEKIVRQNYANAYFELKSFAEFTAYSNDDEKTIIINLRKKVSDLVDSFKNCETAMLLCDYHNYTLSRLAFRKNAVLTKIKRFKDLSADRYNKIQAVHQIVHKGKGIDAAFGIKCARKKRLSFDRKAVYSGKLDPKFTLKDQSNQESFLLQTIQLRAVQWGNYVTDREREQFLPALCEAFSDLASILELPLDTISGRGELAVAIGARGPKRGLAHFEPQKMIINLTKNNGFGSLSHEWAHFIDNQFYKKFHGKNTSYLSDHCAFPSLKDDEMRSILASFEKFFQIFSKRIRRELWGEPANKVKYWLSRREMFARAFESYLQETLRTQDKVSPFLVFLLPSPLWPNQQELEIVTPIFDRLFQWMRKNF